jgi:hypothetical protein
MSRAFLNSSQWPVPIADVGRRVASDGGLPRKNRHLTNKSTGEISENSYGEAVAETSREMYLPV